MRVFVMCGARPVARAARERREQERETDAERSGSDT